MKLNKRHLSLTLTSLMLATVLVTFNHCGLESLTKVKTNKKLSTLHENSTYDPDGDGMNEGGGDATEPTEEVVMQEVHVGVKSFEEIYMTMSVLTGVPYNSGQVDDIYREVAVQLPTDNSIKSFIGVNQVSIVKLAAQYCEELVSRASNNTARSAVWSTTDFNENSDTALAGAKKDRIIDDAIKAFWQVMPADMVEYNMERAELSILVDELRAGESNSRNTTQNVIKSVCTAVLSSAHVTLL